MNDFYKRPSEGVGEVHTPTPERVSISQFRFILTHTIPHSSGAFNTYAISFYPDKKKFRITRELFKYIRRMGM